jgi:hypothetical protein
MTLKEWEKFKIWVTSGNNAIGGYISLYPSAIKFISTPNQHLKEWAEEKKDLFISLHSGFAQVRDDNLFVKVTGYKILVPYTYIKRMKIYNYNY